MPNPSSTTFPSLDLFLQAESPPVQESPTFTPPLTLNEEFTDFIEAWSQYDTYNATDRAILRGNRHVDIRDFTIADRTAALSVLDLSLQSMSDLQGDTVQSLDDSTHALSEGEHWTFPYYNMFPNPNFEVDTSGWSARVGGGTNTLTTFARQTGWFASGIAAVRLTVATGTGATFPGVISDMVAGIEGGASYWVSALVNSVTVGANGVTLSTDWYDSSGVYIGSSYMGNVTGNGIKNPSYKVNAPATARQARIAVYGNVVASGTFDIYVDSVMFTKSTAVTVPNYVDATPANLSLTTHNNIRVMQSEVNTGTTSFQSVTDPIDLSDFASDDIVSMALPNWPGSGYIDLANSFLDMTSNASGDFTAGPTSSVALSASLASLTASGNKEFRALRSAFDGIDMSAVTGVRIRIASLIHAAGNMIANPNFENNVTTGWNNNLATSAVVGAAGARVIRATVTSNGNAGVWYTQQPVVPGRVYAARVRFVAHSAGKQARVGLEWQDHAGTNLGLNMTGVQVSPGSDMILIGQAPAAATKVAVTCYTTGSTIGETMDFDLALLTEVPVGTLTPPPYFDGNSTGFTWTGTANGSATSGMLITFAGLRLLSKTWLYGGVDFNTRDGSLRKSLSLTGDPTTPLAYTHPIVWRASEVAGVSDPKPIDISTSVAFNTGSRLNASQISIYARELTEDFMQQIDINGLSMAQLTNRVQPDLGAAAYNERTQSDLDPFVQSQLNTVEQFDLERTADYLSASWIQFTVQWSATNTLVSITNNEGDGYNFTLSSPLSANTSYILICDLEGTAARAAIYPLGDRGQILYTTPVFDSTLIDDDFVYKRRKGRFGWHASLGDGDTRIDSIRLRSVSYAEYRSLPYESLTPVVGAELYAETSPETDLFTDLSPTGSSIGYDKDNDRSVTGESYRVTDYGPYTQQGLQSNRFLVSDFDQTEITLDVYYPSAADLDATLEFYLRSDCDYYIALPRPRIFPDQWQSIHLRIPNVATAQTGDYRLLIVQNKPVNLNWWVDNVRIFERTVSWHGRGYVDDPWASIETDWVPFQNSYNKDHSGILFQRRARKLQVKAIGHSSDSKVSKVQFKPRYAELGRFVWPDEKLTNLIGPTASYSTSNVGRTYTFNGFTSTDDIGIINWTWNISDGNAYTGPIIQHTFAAAGTYSVTLTVTDTNGLRHTTSANHSVA